MKTTTNTKSAKLAAEILEDGQAELSDAINAAKALLEALQNAEMSETFADFKANLEEAKIHAREVATEIKPILRSTEGVES